MKPLKRKPGQNQKEHKTKPGTATRRLNKMELRVITCEHYDPRATREISLCKINQMTRDPNTEKFLCQKYCERGESITFCIRNSKQWRPREYGDE